MKLVSVLAVAALLAASGTTAADSPDRDPRIRLIEVLPDTGQALVRDQIRDEYDVVRTGDRIRGYEVDAVTGRGIELRHIEHPSERFALAPLRESAPERELRDPYRPEPDIPTVSAPPGSRAERTEVDTRGASRFASSSGRAQPAPLAPTTGAMASAQPETGPTPPRAPVEPIRDPAPGSDMASAAIVAATGGQAEKPAPGSPSPAAAHAPGGSGATAGAPPRTHEVRRGTLDAALSDFHDLSSQVRLRFVAGGVRVDSVTDWSLFHRLGLRTGDLIRRVDERRLSGVGDAAVLYARLDITDRLTVEIERAGKPVILHYRIID